MQCDADGAWSWTTGTESGAFSRDLLYQKLLEDSKPPEPQPVPHDGNPHFKMKAVGASPDEDGCWLDGFKWPSTEAKTLELVGVPEDTKQVCLQLLQ